MDDSDDASPALLLKDHSAVACSVVVAFLSLSELAARPGGDVGLGFLAALGRSPSDAHVHEETIACKPPTRDIHEALGCLPSHCPGLTGKVKPSLTPVNTFHSALHVRRTGFAGTKDHKEPVPGPAENFIVCCLMSLPARHARQGVPLSVRAFRKTFCVVVTNALGPPLSELRWPALPVPDSKLSIRRDVLGPRALRKEGPSLQV